MGLFSILLKMSVYLVPCFRFVTFGGKGSCRVTQFSNFAGVVCASFVSLPI